MEALFYEKLDDRKVKCMACSHFCIIKNGQKGRCGVRENSDGILQSLVYRKVIAQSVDPIEKKPLYHFKPGSYSYSIAAVGCNFKCVFCQNSHIAQMPADQGIVQGRDTNPETIVAEALKTGCRSISYTYTEPTVFCELALETSKIAKEKGLFNIFVTNGFMSDQLLDAFSPYLNAANVDLKAFDEKFYARYCKAKLEPVKRNIKRMTERGILVEITTLLIPGLNDDRDDLAKMADFIAEEAGIRTPWHISRFHPAYKMTDRPATPVSSLEKAYQIGRKAGLRYVYLGNAAGSGFEDTYCHSCQAVLIRRHGYRIENYLDEKGICPECGQKAFGLF